jgi:hypothetical protein
VLGYATLRPNAMGEVDGPVSPRVREVWSIVGSSPSFAVPVPEGPKYSCGLTEELPWLTAADKELIMGRALCNWLDWQLPG